MREHFKSEMSTEYRISYLVSATIMLEQSCATTLRRIQLLDLPRADRALAPELIAEAEVPQDAGPTEDVPALGHLQWALPEHFERRLNSKTQRDIKIRPSGSLSSLPALARQIDAAVPSVPAPPRGRPGTSRARSRGGPRGAPCPRSARHGRAPSRK